MKRITTLLSLLIAFMIIQNACTPAAKEMKAEDYGLSSEGLDAAAAKMQALTDSASYAWISTMVLVDGVVVDRRNHGYVDTENQVPVKDDAIYRIFSMTKPVVAASLMILHDEGKFKLDDPVSKYIPEFANTMVYTPEGLVPQENPITIANLLTHTSGLTYGWDPDSYVDSLYRIDMQKNWRNVPLSEGIKHLASLPLKYQPGTHYEYSLSIDVAGYLVEVLSGMPLDEFMEKRLFVPLKMVDSGFWVPEEKKDRLTMMYTRGEDGKVKPAESEGEDRFLSKPALISGGGGMVSTMDDYARFATMLLNKGELDGVRVLSEEAVNLILTDHLPKGAVGWDSGYGLGGSLNPETKDYGWGGAASTNFVIQPEQNMSILIFTQLMPSDFSYVDTYNKAVRSAILEEE